MNGIAIAGVMAAITNKIPFENLLSGDVPEALETPYTMKMLAFDGRSFSPIIIQMNTLDLKTTEGIKNVIWFETPQTISTFYPSVMFLRGTKIAHVPKGKLKRITYGYIDEDFEFEPIHNLMKFLHF